MTAVTTCNYPFVVHAVQQLCIQYEYLEVDELSLEWIVAVHERFRRRVCCCGAVPMLTKLRRLLGSAHQIAHARAAPKKL